MRLPWVVRSWTACVALGLFGPAGAKEAASRPLDIGELRVVDDFLEGDDLKRAGALISRASKKREGNMVVLNASQQGYEPAKEDIPFFHKLLEKISTYADKHVHPVPDSTDPYPYMGKYFVDSWVLRRYTHDFPEKRVQVHADTEQPGRCLSATLHLNDETGVEGGVLEGYRCPAGVNCRHLELQQAYKPFVNNTALEVQSEAAYKRGRLVFFLAGTPHAVSELKKGDRDVLFVWIGCYPTLRSATEGHVELVEQLIEERADLDSGYARGMTPLHFVVAYGHKPVMDLLLEKRAAVNPEDRLYLRTPLFTAAETGQDHLIDRLIEARGDLCRPNIKGKTPLQAAIDKGFPAAKESLIKHGAEQCPPGKPRPRAKGKPKPPPKWVPKDDLFKKRNEL